MRIFRSSTARVLSHRERLGESTNLRQDRMMKIKLRVVWIARGIQRKTTRT